MTEEEKVKAIKKTIEKCRPYIQADGGDVEFVKLEDDICYVKVHGACLGCAALDYTLKEGVEAMLMDEVEGIKEVRLAQDDLSSQIL
jgi:Fe-S cluster biogenesis protein NfuA